MWFVPWDVFAVRFGDLTIERRLTRLEKAQKERPPEASTAYAEVGCSPNLAEAVAVRFCAASALSLREVEHIRRLGEIQELIADRFYARLRFGRVATIAIAAAGLVALPQETVEKYLSVDYAVFGAIVFVGTVLVLAVMALITVWPGRLAGRRARHKRLFKAVVVYLESLASQNAPRASSVSNSIPD
ncbi:MAG TPA: hypothetical protein VGJ58_02390 [Gaiellaceae bacterium]|jgi:hypothetical protein